MLRLWRDHDTNDKTKAIFSTVSKKLKTNRHFSIFCSCFLQLPPSKLAFAFDNLNRFLCEISPVREYFLFKVKAHILAGIQYCAWFYGEDRGGTISNACIMHLTKPHFISLIASPLTFSLSASTLKNKPGKITLKRNQHSKTIAHKPITQTFIATRYFLL